MDNKAINIIGTHSHFLWAPKYGKTRFYFFTFWYMFYERSLLKVPIWDCDLTIAYLFAMECIIIVIIKGRALESVKKNILKWLSSGCFFKDFFTNDYHGLLRNDKRGIRNLFRAPTKNDRWSKPKMESHVFQNPLHCSRWLEPCKLNFLLDFILSKPIQKINFGLVNPFLSWLSIFRPLS